MREGGERIRKNKKVRVRGDREQGRERGFGKGDLDSMCLRNKNLLLVDSHTRAERLCIRGCLCSLFGLVTSIPCSFSKLLSHASHLLPCSSGILVSG